MKGTSLQRRRGAWLSPKLLGDLLLIAAILLLAIFVHGAMHPVAGTVRYTQGEVAGEQPLPFVIPSNETREITATMELDVPQLAPRWYVLTVDDCVTGMTIDRRQVPIERLPFCVPTVPQRIDLGGLLTAGRHIVSVSIYDVDGTAGFNLRASQLDPVLLALSLFALFLILTAAHLLAVGRLRHLHGEAAADPFTFPLLRRLRSLSVQPLGLLILTCVAASLLYLWVQPRALSGYYAGPDEQPHLIQEIFLAPNGEKQTYDVFFWVRYAPFRPPTIHLMGDDCIRELRINGAPVPALEAEICDHKRGAQVNVEDFLHDGINTFQLRLRNLGGPGSFRIGMNASDPLGVLLFYVAFISGGAALWLILRGTTIGSDRLIVGILWLGIALRFVYFFLTPFYIRAPDVSGHIEYMQHITDHGTLPAVTQAWESFQPPLYYLIGAGILELVRLFGGGGFRELIWLQAFGLLLSVTGFFIGSAVIRHFLSAPSRRMGYACALAVLATYPGLVYFASRINNDVLVQFLIIVSVYGMIRFNASRRRPYWCLSVAALTLGVFTKTNALLLLPPLLLVTVGYPFPFRFRRWLLAAFLFLWVAGCYFGLGVWRGGYEDLSHTTNIVANTSTLNGDLRVTNEVAFYTSFSPFHVLAVPFSDAWSDASRRQYFWEFLLRSSFFGDFGNPGPFLGIGRVLLVAGMLNIPILFYGIILALRRRMNGSFILFSYLISTAILHMVFRWQYPFSTSQDFRYVAAVTVAIAAFIGIACAEAPKCLQPLFTIIASSLAVLSAGFLFALFIIS